MGARLLSIVACVALMLFAGSGTALAGRDWCAKDPILVFANGTRVQWLALLPADELANLTGPVTFTFTLPENAGPVDVLVPEGSTGERVVISFAGARWEGRGGMPVQARVFVPSSTSFTFVTIAAGNVTRSVGFGGVSNAATRASVKTDAAHWYALFGASTIAASYSVSSDTTIDIP